LGRVRAGFAEYVDGLMVGAEGWPYGGGDRAWPAERGPGRLLPRGHARYGQTTELLANWSGRLIVRTLGRTARRKGWTVCAYHRMGYHYLVLRITERTPAVRACGSPTPRGSMWPL